MRACRSGRGGCASPWVWEHTNAAENDATGGGVTEIYMDHGVVHKLYGDVWGSVLELGVGSGDTGMAWRVGGSVRGSQGGARGHGEEGEVT